MKSRRRFTRLPIGSVHVVSCFLTALLVCGSPPADAAHGADAAGAADAYMMHSVPQQSVLFGHLGDTVHMKLGKEAAAWVPRFIPMLRANRPPRFELGRIAVFSGMLGQSYLAITWRGETIQTPAVEFHKLIRASDGRSKLQFLRRLSDTHAGLVPPSGEQIFAGEPTVAAVSLGAGGSDSRGYRMRLIQMKRNTVDITPDWAERVVDVVDLDKDGQYEVVTISDRWTGLFDGRGGAGPHLPIVLARVENKFVPKCRTHAKAYKAWIETLIRYGENSKYSLNGRAEFLTDVLLAQAQIGQFARARKTFAAMETLYEGATNEYGPDKRFVLDHFSDVLAQSERNHSFPCPVSATEIAGGRFRPESPINKFRVPAP